MKAKESFASETLVFPVLGYPLENGQPLVNITVLCGRSGGRKKRNMVNTVKNFQFFPALLNHYVNDKFVFPDIVMV